MAGSSSSSAINTQSGKSLVIRPNAASISKGSLRIQVENIVDFGSLERNGVEITRFFSHQQWGPFFRMLNGPTYTELVRNFWVKACIVTEKEAREEEASLVRSKPELKGKSRLEMGLSDFTETEVRSNVLGLEMVITESLIRSLLQVPSGGLFVTGQKGDSEFADKIEATLHEGRPSKKVIDMATEHRIIYKIVLGCLLPRESSADQMSWDHKHFMTFLLSKYPIDLPAYIFQHLCYSINETKKHQKMNVPYARLISEFLYQGKLIQKLAELGLASDQELGTTYGKVLNGSILFNMKLKKKKDLVTDHQLDLVINTASSDYIENFPLISKHDNPEVIARFIHQFRQDNPDVHIEYDMIPDAPQDIMRKSKKIKDKEVETADKTQAQKPSNKSRSVTSGAAREAAELNAQAVLPSRTRKGASVSTPEARKAAAELAASVEMPHKGRAKPG